MLEDIKKFFIIVLCLHFSVVNAKNTKQVEPRAFSQIEKSITAAVKLAHQYGIAGSFVLVDVHGQVLVSYRMPAALPATYDFAKSKAVTAVALGVATGDLPKKLPKDILDHITTT